MWLYWNDHLVGRLNRVRSYAGMWGIAKIVLSRMQSPIAQVCGPISTGGLGSREENRRVFELAIEWLKSTGLNVFDQMPFQDRMVHLVDRYQRKHNGVYDMRLLNDFYLPLFASGKINTVYFLPNWPTSTGAVWERETITNLKGKKRIEICDFPEGSFAEIVAKVRNPT